jgi:3-hydroxy acid dehydrogenase/malonic semialdehyde reductase
VKGVAKAPEIEEADVKVMFDTNVTGLINMTQAILPIFKKREDGGAGDVINIGSIAGREPYPGGSIYCATKAAVRAFTDALRRELIATRIRIIEIDPGQVETVSTYKLGLDRLKTNHCHRNSQSLDFMVINRKPMQSMRKQSFKPSFSPNLTRLHSGCEPLTPDDIAEIVVFTSGRRENVVVADTLVFPNHQVRCAVSFCMLRTNFERLLLRLCTRSHRC